MPITVNTGQYAVGWFTLSLINAGLAQSKGRSGLAWWLASLLLGPLCTLLIVASDPVKPSEPDEVPRRKLKLLEIWRVFIIERQRARTCGEVGKCNSERNTMKALLLLVGLCVLFVLCWPLALLALVLFPFVWLISLPLRLLGITLEAAFAAIRALLFLPARLLGGRRHRVIS